MITENELMISNKSYVNKDFATIYPELLDYVKDLTNKWNPQTSNESDPGIVLLKLLGFIGDKLNYNVDKNVLENFVLSCTQESSMRKNLYPLGYNMKYYRSATTEVQFTYVGDKLDNSSNPDSFQLPRFTSITSDDDSVQFVLMNPVTINGRNIVSSGMAIQGRKDTLVVGDSDVIQLENIDSNNRIYFPTSMVAENGVFIQREGTNEQDWLKVDNLNVLTPHQDVFVFGFDSARGLPYIEFPNDIVELIGSGLHIDYIITNGLDGNISARTLTKIVSPDSVPSDRGQEINFKTEDESSLLIVKNLSASIDGANPETIDEAYNNFKKTIGTFDTLVTCRDYANYIYNMHNSDGVSYVVSNTQVSDRRDDITYSTGVVSFDEYGQKKINVKNNINENINAYDLFLYPLNPITAYTIEGYNYSFKPLMSTTYIKNDLENSKCASHDYFDLLDSNLYAFKNMLKLNAKIATKQKVTSYERRNIIENVIMALIKKFNARNVDYGKEIPYNEILKTIENADTRISYVNLLDPEISTKVLIANGDEFPLISSAGLDFLISLLAHNILNGNVELFSYDDDFNYDFGQKKITGKQMKLKELSWIETKTEIALPNGNASGKDYGYKLLDNEVIQLLAPSLISEIAYTAYTYYHIKLNEGTSITDGTNYQLKDNEELWIWLSDSNNNVAVKKYEKGQIIQPKGLSLTNTPSEGSGTINKTFVYDGVEKTMSFLYLGANASIEIRKINQTKFINPTYFYWIRNNATNALFTSADATTIRDPFDPESTINGFETILGDGEYIFYTDDGFNDLVSLGSGTTIKSNITYIPSVELITYEDVADDGLLSLKDRWVRLNLTKGTETTTGTWLIAQENAILTLTQGDTITWSNSSESPSETLNLGNKLKIVDGTISYTFSDGSEATPLEQYNLNDPDSKWKIKSRLDINCGKNFAQKINASYQSITFYDRYYSSPSDTDHFIELGEGDQFNLNESYQFSGSDYIDVSSIDVATQEPIWPFSVYCYELQVVNGEEKTLERDIKGYSKYSIYIAGYLETGTDDSKYKVVDSSSFNLAKQHYTTLYKLVDNNYVEVSEYDSSITAYYYYLQKSEFDYDLPNINKYKVLMLYVILSEDGSTLTLTSTGGGMRYYNTDWGTFGTTLTITKDGIYNIEFEPSVTHLKIVSNKVKASSVIIDYLRYINDVNYTRGSYGLNPCLGIDANLVTEINQSSTTPKTKAGLEKELLDKIVELDNYDFDLSASDPKFYYTCRISNSKIIEQDNLLGALAFYDVNNVANKFTISQIDMSDIDNDIDIMRSSRL